MFNVNLKLNFNSEVPPPPSLFQGWMNYLGLGSKKTPSTGQGVLGKRDANEYVSNVDANKRLAAAALSAVKDAAALATIGRGKVEVCSVLTNAFTQTSVII